ncbi:glucokinase [Spiroplasma syrphidicola EA-1]|uniref:Glucokinase n=1 Tax=Spiroplasma syrphidicola EA-1 TaxID=1276229 RepID=R4UKA1_9MOLU|nr:ROK family protein [Spiroplasma syrphidicola]AGM25696.1 glucokinase [Spiroplasma syrphidicola EA-1]
MNKILVIDLGGTSAKCAVFADNKEMLLEFKVKTDITNILPNLKTAINEQLTTHQMLWSEIRAIGFALPGFLDDKTGVVTLASNLGWKDFPIRQEAQALFQKQIFIINDANAAALGEFWNNSDQTIHSLALYTLGTGIGGGLILNDQLWTGATGYAGEFGHGGNFQNQFPCSCGLKNCIEPLSSATGLTKLINRKAKTAPNSSLGKLVQHQRHPLGLGDIKPLLENNDQETIAVLEQGLEPLAQHIATLIYVINPALIILAGGVTNLGPELLAIITRLVHRATGEFLWKTFELKISALQDKAGMYGAAYYAFKNLNLL